MWKMNCCRKKHRRNIGWVIHNKNDVEVVEKKWQSSHSSIDWLNIAILAIFGCVGSKRLRFRSKYWIRWEYTLQLPWMSKLKYNYGVLDFFWSLIDIFRFMLICNDRFSLLPTIIEFSLIRRYSFATDNIHSVTALGWNVMLASASFSSHYEPIKISLNNASMAIISARAALQHKQEAGMQYLNNQST